MLWALVIPIPILLGAPARAQFIGPGSTIQGDYLRGVGIAAAGMGVYNLRTAQANAINTQTWINWNEYIWNVAKNENKEAVEHRDAMLAKHKAAYNAVQKRYVDNPEDLDLMTGNALNAVLEQLNDPKIAESSFRSAEVSLPVDVVRRIPFKLAERNEKFSMNRLAIKNKGKLPVAFQDDRLARELRIYARALDTALEQAMNGKLQQSAIEDVEKAVEGLRLKLNAVIPPSNDRTYIEAKTRLDELDRTTRMLKTHKVEIALGEIDKYSGTTVNELRLFMQRHNLQFAPAENPDERTVYPELYTALVQQREKLSGAFQPAGK
jgi:hypothetical protein